MVYEKKEPSKKQADYAKSIAEALNLKLPEEKTSAAYGKFIDENLKRFEETKPQRSKAVHYTDEQIARANAVDIVSYARSRGLELKKAGNDYRVENYGGGFLITPEKNNWNWFNGSRGGGVVQLCMFLENKTWPQAIGTLIGEEMEPMRTAAPKPEPKPKKEFHLPEENDTTKHVYAYLTQTRGIDEGIVKEMLDKKYIYENKMRSCVFVGRDKEGKARHASVRSTNTDGKAYKKDVSGSQKKYSFSITGTSGALNVFEAPIDALSYMSMQKLHGKPVNDSYLALGGVTDKALERFLEDNDTIKVIRICTDKDEAGENAAARMDEKYGKEYKIVREFPKHKDFNEDLIAIRKSMEEKEQEKPFSEQAEEDQPEKDANVTPLNTVAGEKVAEAEADVVEEEKKVQQLNQDTIVVQDLAEQINQYIREFAENRRIPSVDTILTDLEDGNIFYYEEFLQKCAEELYQEGSESYSHTTAGDGADAMKVIEQYSQVKETLFRLRKLPVINEEAEDKRNLLTWYWHIHDDGTGSLYMPDGREFAGIGDFITGFHPDGEIVREIFFYDYSKAADIRKEGQKIRFYTGEDEKDAVMKRMPDAMNDYLPAERKEQFISAFYDNTVKTLLEEEDKHLNQSHMLVPDDEIRDYLFAQTYDTVQPAALKDLDTNRYSGFYSIHKVNDKHSAVERQVGYNPLNNEFVFVDYHNAICQEYTSFSDVKKFMTKEEISKFNEVCVKARVHNMFSLYKNGIAFAKAERKLIADYAYQADEGELEEVFNQLLDLKFNGLSTQDWQQDLAGEIQKRAEKSFSEQVDDVLTKKASRYSDLKVCDTPEILQRAGCRQLPMFYTQKHLKDALKPKGDKGESIHHHGLTVKQIKAVPELLENPVMIYDSLSRNDSLVVVTSEVDVDKSPIVVVVRPDGEAKYAMEVVNANFVLSIHGRDNFDNQIKNVLEQDKLLFCDKQKSQELFSVLGLQLSQGFNNLDFDQIIHPSRNIVNPENNELLKVMNNLAESVESQNEIVDEGHVNHEPVNRELQHGAASMPVAGEQNEFVLTGAGVSGEMQDILARLAEGREVDIDEINATKEIRYCRSISENGEETYLLEGREDKQKAVLEYMESLGSASGHFDKNGRMLYNGDIAKDHRLDIVIGLIGAGKSSTVTDVISQEFHSKVIDNDMAKAQFVEYQDGLGARMVHEEAQMICDTAFAESLSRGENIVLPKVGSNVNKLLEQTIAKAKDFGYEVNVHFVDLERSKALGRVLGRLISDGRFLDPGLIYQYCPDKEHNYCEQSYEALRTNQLVDGYSRWDNDVAKGETPYLVESHNLAGEYINRARVKENEKGAVEHGRTGLQNNGDRRQGFGKNDGEYGGVEGASAHGVYEDGTKGLSGGSRGDSERGGSTEEVKDDITRRVQELTSNVSPEVVKLAEKVKDEPGIHMSYPYIDFAVAHKQAISERKMERIPIVINAFGGPGSGKSVSCMDICQQLKKLGYNAEYVQEYAKELVYDKNWDLLDGAPENQFIVLKEQLKRVDRLYSSGTVDFIVTDSSILLNGVYNKALTLEYDSMVTSLYNDFENFTYFVERDASAYQQEGRIQNLEESQKIDENIKQLLKEKGIYYGTYNHETIDKIVSNSIRTFNRVNHIVEKPTEKQKAYAEKIAGTLNISLPEEDTKAAYKEFIHVNQEQFSQSATPVTGNAVVSDTYEGYLEQVAKDGNMLKDVPEEHYTEELLLAAVANWGAVIRQIPEEKITPRIAMASVQQYGTNLKYVPAAMQTEEICIAAYVSSNGKSACFTPKEIKDRVKEQGLKLLEEKNKSNPGLKRRLDEEKLQEQGQEWVSRIEKMLSEHEENPEAMIEDIAFAAKFHQYSARNIQLMLQQNRGITYVASASAFQKMGYHVKDNEPAMLGRVPIITNYIVDKEGKRVYSSDYTLEIKKQLKEGTLKEYSVAKSFRFVASFYDISQTDCPPEDYPSIYHMGISSELHQEVFDAMKEFAQKTLGFRIMVTDLKSISLRGNCEPDNKIIRINNRLEATMALSTLCHEIAHGIIHTSENSAKMSAAQKECEADVMDVMLETSLGLEVSESRREHLYNAFHDYKKEQAEKEKPYEVTLEKLIDRVQTKVFRPYAEDINGYLNKYLPAEGRQNEQAAEEVIRNLALLDSVYDKNHQDLIDGERELFDSGRIDSYRELYHRAKEEYRMSNSFVPKLAVLKSMNGENYNLYEVHHADEEIVDLIKTEPELVSDVTLSFHVKPGDILALKENILSPSRLYQVAESRLIERTKEWQSKFAGVENEVNCGFGAERKYKCMHNLLEHGLELEPFFRRQYDSLCRTFGFEKSMPSYSTMQFMARINMITEELSQNNRELVAEYVFRTGNFEKAERYAKRLEQEPGSVRQLLQEMRLVDSYKYMLWTIAEYENNHDVPKEKRLTTGAYNYSAIPVLSENVHTLEQINKSFLLIRKHASAESTKYYEIVGENENIYRIAYVELDAYQPKTTYSMVSFADEKEAERFYQQYLETGNTRLVSDTKPEELPALEHAENQIALSDITAIGRTIASQKHQYKENGMTEEGALDMLRSEIITEYPDIRPVEDKEAGSDLQVLKDFKKMAGYYGEEHFIELCNLNDFTDKAAVEASFQLSEWLIEQKNVLEDMTITGIDSVKQCVDAALDCSLTASDMEKAFNAIDSAVLSSEFSNLEKEFEGFDEYNNVLDTLKASQVTPDKFCYVDYAVNPAPFLYTSDPAGNIYRKSLGNEWSSNSVQELYTRLKENGYEICTSMEDFRAYSANSRLGISDAPEKAKNEAYIRILESTCDMLPKNQIFSIYDFKNVIDKLNSGSQEFHDDITYKLVTRTNQEIHSYLDTYIGSSGQNVYEQMYEKAQETAPELSKVISRQYYQDQLNFSERHLVRPLLEQLKKQQKTAEDSEELDVLIDANDKLKEQIKKLDLAPADAEILKLSMGNIQIENQANIQRQMQMNQQTEARKQEVKNISPEI